MTTTPQCLLSRDNGLRADLFWKEPKSLGREGPLGHLSGASQAWGRRWVGGQVPCDRGSAKDTRLNVGSHDVTGDVEVDADEFALERKGVGVS